MANIHSEKKPYPCPNAPNCRKVCYFDTLFSPHNRTITVFLFFYLQRFKSKRNCKFHSAICRAKKPTPKENEDESEGESSSSEGRAQESDSSDFTRLKKCTVVLQRKGYIDKAAKEGFTTMTYTRYVKNSKDGKKRNGGYWQIIA